MLYEIHDKCLFQFGIFILQAVKQSIGRGRRHNEDFCYLLLVDVRYNFGTTKHELNLPITDLDFKIVKNHLEHRGNT